MNYTKNYRLPQWVKEDRIMMDDFNAAMASMEAMAALKSSIMIRSSLTHWGRR